MHRKMSRDAPRFCVPPVYVRAIDPESISWSNEISAVRAAATSSSPVCAWIISGLNLPIILPTLTHTGMPYTVASCGVPHATTMHDLVAVPPVSMANVHGVGGVIEDSAGGGLNRTPPRDAPYAGSESRNGRAVEPIMSIE